MDDIKEQAEKRRLQNAKLIDGRTQLLALIGSPLGHSGSPAMYNYSFDRLGLNCCYLCLEIQEEQTGQAMDALRLFGVRGFNVTMPCKTRAMDYLDEADPAARLIGATNTVVNENGRLVGYNTDGYGWVRACRERGVEVTGSRMTICGSGGAATAIEITAALEGMARIDIFARKDSFYENAEKTVEKIRSNVPGCEVTLHDLADSGALYDAVACSDIFTNATRVGMKPADDQTLIEDTAVFRPGLAVSDVVYNPKETRLLREAAAAGCRVLPGTGMLLWQGVEAFRLYTGLEMPVEEVGERFF